MYIQAIAEKYHNASVEIIDKLHEENKKDNIILNTRFKQCYFPFHAENLSLKFAFSGNEFYELDRRQLSVSKSNFLIVNEGQEHASWIESDGWVNSFAIYFNPTFVAASVDDVILKDEKLLDNPFNVFSESKELAFFQTLIPLDENLVYEVAAFKNYLEATGGREHLPIDEELRKVLHRIICLHQAELAGKLCKVDALKRSTKLEIIKRLYMARDFVESFYTENLSIKDVSRACFLSENLMMRYFKAAFGISIHQYLINRRLEFAREQILSTNLTFNEITYRSGFDCPSSFGRLFKARFGITPNFLRSDFRDR
ncbi:helix-turn-helix transcriptional regulator [Desertivirga arenae]|uniref:helix-turn-helix transcriptional regulator n=1 Tax=Desertivirga arenae TaxID=2810309 RepID=UPI001A973D2B|nr:AraC family transcriptional regulator [Pedobacter sp. SYSU D00823]